MSAGMKMVVTASDKVPEALNILSRSLSALAKDGPVMVAIEHYFPRRSLDQNALMWSLCSDIAKHLNETFKPESPFDRYDLHDRLLVQFYGQENRRVGSVSVTRVPQTRKWDKAQMSAFIEKIIAWALEHKIPIDIPACEEYERYREAQS